MKLKVCDGCGKERPIWKSSGTGGLKLCQQCWSCHKSNNALQKPKTTPSSSKLKQKSDKQQAIDKAYTLMRKAYMTQNPLCNIKISGVCTGSSTDVHHAEGRGIKTLVQNSWISCCRACHSWVHSNPLEARELGFLK